MITAVCQRWRDRRGAYRPAGEVFDPARYGVELIGRDRPARSFVEQHHYSGSYPAARCRVGLYRVAGGLRSLAGVAVFSVPMQQRVIPRWTGQEPSAGVELGRFVLLPEVRANGESWFLARAFSALAAELPGVRAVLSYSDPMRRLDSEGRVVLPGHVGTIYQASNARFVGRSRARRQTINSSGRVVPGRAVAKIRAGHQGARYSEELLVRLGAPKRKRGEAPAEWVDRALASGRFSRVRHPGALAYVFALGSSRKRRAIARAFPPPLPYLKARDAIVGPRPAPQQQTLW